MNSNGYVAHLLDQWMEPLTLTGSLDGRNQGRRPGKAGHAVCVRMAMLRAWMAASTFT